MYCIYHSRQSGHRDRKDRVCERTREMQQKNGSGSKYVTEGILRLEEIFWFQLFEDLHRYGQASDISQA